MTSRLIAQIKAASSRAIRRDDDGRPLALPGGRAKAPAQPHLRFPSNLAHRTRCGGHLHLLLAANAWRIPIAPENSCRATSISFTTPRAVFAGKAARDTKRSSFPINPVHALSHWSQYCNLIRMDVEQIRNLANLGLSSMHESAMDKFRVFVDAYLRPQAGASLEVLDVGSRAVGNGSPTHRAAIVAHGWRYVGLDIEAGENVDLQVSDGYDWKMVEDDSFDVVLCSQVLEHTRYPWRLTQEMARVLRPLGLAFLTSPSTGHVHRYPEDCFRYYPDGLSALAAASGLQVVEAHIQHRLVYRSNLWRDALLIAQKPIRTPDEAGRERARLQLSRLACRSNLLSEHLAEVDFSPRAPRPSQFPDFSKSTSKNVFADRDAALAKTFDPVRRLAEVRRHLSLAVKVLTRSI
jgi:SAM-dependent methyltransferase